MSFNACGIEIRNCQVVCETTPLFATPVNACFSPGRLNIISGPNGSGKTSVLDILAFRVKPKEACTVLRSGHSQPREIAYLPQTTAHILDIKIKQLVDLAFRNTPKLPSVPFEVENFLENPSREVGDLSGGQQQMLLFWLVAFQPLHIFIYDEPLRHLDDHAAAFVTWTIEQQIHRGELVILSDHSDGSRWHVTNHCLDLTTCIYHR